MRFQNIVVSIAYKRDSETAKELHKKIMNTNYREKYNEIHNIYKKSLLTKDQIYDSFEKQLLKIIEEKNE